MGLIRKTVEKGKQFCKDHPVEVGFVGTALLGWILASLSVKKADPEWRAGEGADASAVLLKNVTTQSSQLPNVRSYSWNELGHNVKAHDRHYSNGKVIRIEEYYKPTGSKKNSA